MKAAFLVAYYRRRKDKDYLEIWNRNKFSKNSLLQIKHKEGKSHLWHHVIVVFSKREVKFFLLRLFLGSRALKRGERAVKKFSSSSSSSSKKNG